MIRAACFGEALIKNSINKAYFNLFYFKVRPSNAKTGSLTLQVQCHARPSCVALPTSTADTSTSRRTAAPPTNGSVRVRPMGGGSTKPSAVISAGT